MSYVLYYRYWRKHAASHQEVVLTTIMSQCLAHACPFAGMHSRAWVPPRHPPTSQQHPHEHPSMDADTKAPSYQTHPPAAPRNRPPINTRQHPGLSVLRYNTRHALAVRRLHNVQTVIWSLATAADAV